MKPEDKEKVYRTGSIKMIDRERNRIVAVISTNDVDRDNEIVDIKTLDIETYRDKNPILLVDHRNSAEKGIGKAVRVWKNDDDTELYAEFEIAREATKLADDIFKLFDAGVLRSFSIGFSVGEVQNSEGLRLLVNCKLHETSVVAVPANENAGVIEVEKIYSGEKDVDAVIKSYEATDEGRLAKALRESAESKELLKEYRNFAKKIRKSLGLTAESNEVENLEKLYAYNNSILKDFSGIQQEVAANPQSKSHNENFAAEIWKMSKSK